MSGIEIVNTTLDNIGRFGVCGYKSPNKPGFPEKVDWLRSRFSEGLQIRTLFSETDGAQGMIEYVPGEYCWRPVDADSYMVIHCLFVGFKRAYKQQGHGARLLDACVYDARRSGMCGVAVVTRKGPFMAGSALFLKHGFEVVDRARPDFELLVRASDSTSPRPAFKRDLATRAERYGRGLTFVRADQCPYTVKNVTEMFETARARFGIEARVVNLTDARSAQLDSPGPFGTFGIVYDGRLVADHPISNARFINVMNGPLGE